MNILHITNSYGGTDVYTNLYASLDRNYSIQQHVYVPLNPKSYNREGNKLIDFNNYGSEIVYSKNLKKYHSFLYGLKISNCIKDIKKKIDLASIDLIHANTLCFDGAIAYELSREYGIPYITAVRNTDVNAYYKRLIWRKRYFTKVIRNATKVIFISPKYKENFIANQVPKGLRKEISSKMLVIPNGVNSLFLTNQNKCINNINKSFKVIFVAAFYPGKGLAETIKAIELLRSKGIDITFNAIGKGLPNRPKDSEYIRYVESISAGKNWVQLQPYMAPEEIIKEMRQSDIFVMVSSPETFGLVYVEALTQGLPIVYAKGQGFDGFYNDGVVGYPALAGNVESIAQALESVIENYSSIKSNIYNLSLDKDFDWANIATKYINLYNEILNK